MSFVCGLGLILAIIWASYEIGFTKGSHRYYTSQKAAFLTYLKEIEDLRSGDTRVVIRTLETRCYSCASEVLNMPDHERDDATIASALAKLSGYRSRYASPEVEWSPTERRLVGQLDLWKQSHK